MFIGCSSNYVYSLAPDHLKATAQTLAGSVSSLADIIGNLLGGYLLDAMGVRSFYTVCGGLILGAALFFLASFALGARLSGRPSAPSRQRPCGLNSPTGRLSSPLGRAICILDLCIRWKLYKIKEATQPLPGGRGEAISSLIRRRFP